jgi:secreted Zn-dependent insulinase-like peptidase
LGHVKSTVIDKDEVPENDRMVKMNEKVVYQLNETNPKQDIVNPNSALLYNIYDGEFSYVSYVLIRVMIETISGQLVAELRTTENLGYVV